MQTSKRDAHHPRDRNASAKETGFAPQAAKRKSRLFERRFARGRENDQLDAAKGITWGVLVGSALWILVIVLLWFFLGPF